jgi:hypothetical protein
MVVLMALTMKWIWPGMVRLLAMSLDKALKTSTTTGSKGLCSSGSHWELIVDIERREDSRG